ncbi:hypothetical protein CGC20_20085 [Leishmania donovani]|uniref:Uncharacterized protein n=1 Tax=Leishmania donovani TaxID=5661 RepID=A0A504XPS6_LEIDO|nr:hypothetical protein CGC20_20085 [Leishmania donovani]
MDPLCADAHDAAAASEVETSEADGAPDATVAVLPVEQAVDASTPAQEGQQAIAGEASDDFGHGLCEVQVRAPEFLQAPSDQPASPQLSAATHGVATTPRNSTAFVPNMPAAPRGIPTAAAAVADSQAWVINFAPSKPIPTRKMTKKERETIKQLRLRSQTIGSGAPTATMTALAAGDGLGADSEGNTVVTLGVGTSAASPSSPLQVVHLETLAVDREALIPTNLPTTRADLEARLVLRLPRLLCVSKQYPRGCGIASLASVYNYLYSWLGESAVGANRAPHSQEELMSILGFEPPFGDIAWGPFTGNATLIRWFHALNRHFGVRGRAYILYKAHGSGNTAHLYANNTEALAAVKAALRDPHCALIYHCYNHYMVPIGYQDIPLAQTDFLKPDVPESNCDTTIFIGEVSRGRHEAMYARKWSQIVKDIECKSPFFFNIRHPEQGVQRREPKKKSYKEGVSEGAGAAAPHATTAATTAAANRSPSGVYSAAVSILAASTNAPPGSAATVPHDINDNDVDADVLDNAARSTSSDTPSGDTAGSLSVKTELQPQVVVEEELAAAECGINCEESAGASPAARSASLLLSDAPGALLADNAMASFTEAIDSVPEPSPPPASSSPRQKPTQFGNACARAGKAAESPHSSQPARSPAKSKKGQGNLHCIICFRNDEVEPHLERYEDAPVPLAGAAEAPPWRSLSLPSSDNSSSSNADDA